MSDLLYGFFSFVGIMVGMFTLIVVVGTVVGSAAKVLQVILKYIGVLT